VKLFTWERSGEAGEAGEEVRRTPPPTPPSLMKNLSCPDRTKYPRVGGGWGVCPPKIGQTGQELSSYLLK